MSGRESAVHRAVANLPFVLPTSGRRHVLAMILWRAAGGCRRAPLPPAERTRVLRSYLERIHILSAPGPLDFAAYDQASGVKHGFFADWWTHAPLARSLYFAQREL
jgi:hypothetical protein